MDLGKSSGSGVSIPYKIFAPVSATSPSNDTYGLRIWGANGELVYDSGLPTLSPIAISGILPVSVYVRVVYPAYPGPP